MKYTFCFELNVTPTKFLSADEVAELYRQQTEKAVRQSGPLLMNTPLLIVVAKSTKATT